MTTATIVFLLGAMTATADAERDAAVALAKKQLGTALGVAESAIELDKAEAVDWSDASLGCPEKGMMYAQVITPGHRVSLKAGGKSHVVHVGAGRAVVCGASRKPPARPSQSPRG
jgi:hypothetical protein